MTRVFVLPALLAGLLMSSAIAQAQQGAPLPAPLPAPPSEGSRVAYEPWGRGTTRFVWGEHRLYVNNAPWERRWTNRGVYVHPFSAVPRHVETRAAERHASHERSEREREAERRGRHPVEEHRRDNDRR
jgi:hypothetical protein